jgi:hypothetical protein
MGETERGPTFTYICAQQCYHQDIPLTKEWEFIELTANTLNYADTVVCPGSDFRQKCDLFFGSVEVIQVI